MGSSPGWSNGDVPTAAQWIDAFTGKQDDYGISPAVLNALADGMMVYAVKTFATLPAPVDGLKAYISDCPTNPVGHYWSAVTTGGGTYRACLVYDGGVGSWKIG